METINSILKEIGFSVVLQRSDDKGHYPVLLAKKVFNLLNGFLRK